MILLRIRSRSDAMATIHTSKIIRELLEMNLSSLAALVRLGNDAGDPLKFISDATDRFIVSTMIKQVR